MGDKNPKNKEKQKKIHDQQKQGNKASVHHMKREQERQQHGGNNQNTDTKPEYKKAG